MRQRNIDNEKNAKKEANNPEPKNQPRLKAQICLALHEQKLNKNKEVPPKQTKNHYTKNFKPNENLVNLTHPLH